MFGCVICVLFATGYVVTCLSEGESATCPMNVSMPNPLLKLMPRQTVLVGGVEVPLPVFSSYEINEYNIAAWGYAALMQKHPHNRRSARFEEKYASWEQYVKERCVLEPYYHGYV